MLSDATRLESARKRAEAAEADRDALRLALNDENRRRQGISEEASRLRAERDALAAQLERCRPLVEACCAFDTAPGDVEVGAAPTEHEQLAIGNIIATWGAAYAAVGLIAAPRRAPAVVVAVDGEGPALIVDAWRAEYDRLRALSRPVRAAETDAAVHVFTLGAESAFAALAAVRPAQHVKDSWVAEARSALHVAPPVACPTTECAKMTQAWSDQVDETQRLTRALAEEKADHAQTEAARLLVVKVEQQIRAELADEKAAREKAERQRDIVTDVSKEGGWMVRALDAEREAQRLAEERVRLVTERDALAARLERCRPLVEAVRALRHADPGAAAAHAFNRVCEVSPAAESALAPAPDAPATSAVDLAAIGADMKRCERVLGRETGHRASQSCRDLADAVASMLRRESARGGGR